MSRRHRAWLASLRFADLASRLTIADYLHSHDVLLARRDGIEAELQRLVSDSPWAQTIARLRCLRGIDTLSALGLCAEVGAFDRFTHPDQLSAYLGIVPSENTTGQHRRQGAITKAGSTHARGNATGSSRSRSPASSPASAGRSPPGEPRPDQIPPASVPAGAPLRQARSLPHKHEQTNGNGRRTPAVPS